MRVLILLLCGICSFWLGSFLEKKNTMQMNETLVDFITASERHAAFDAMYNVKLLFALKEEKILFAEELITNSLIRYLRAPRSSRDDFENKVFEKARQYQKMFCSDQCLGLQIQ